MKKIIALALVAVSLAATLASCGGKFVCDACGEEKTGKKSKVDFLGVSMTICSECKADYDEAMDELANLDLSDLELGL